MSHQHGASKCGKLRLHYFPVRARGEMLRWLLVAAKADWEDVRIKSEDWPNHKKNYPLGQLPVLECETDGKKHQLTQTATIARCIAHWFDLAGRTANECAQADEAFEVVREAVEFSYRAWMEQDAAKKEKLIAQFKDDIFPRNVCYLEWKLKQNGGKFIAGGESLTYADLAIACWFNNLSSNKWIDCDAQKAKYPMLSDLNSRIHEHPDIKAWIAKRPASDM